MQEDKNNPTEMISSQESDDSICFEELLTPGGTHWNFGSFQQANIRNIYRMRLNETRSVALSEHATNLAKSKHDPLVVIEAKIAMAKGESMGEKAHSLESENLKKLREEVETSKIQEENMQEEIANTEGETQDALEVEIYGQEEELRSQKLQGMEEEEDPTTKDQNFVLVKENMNLGSKGKALEPTLASQESTFAAEQQIEQGRSWRPYLTKYFTQLG
jgi:hypothetical protein